MFNNLKIKLLIEEMQSIKKNIRIQDIANEIGIAKGSLENYRDGFSKPTVEMLEKIANYFKVDMNYFFDNEAIIKSDIKLTEAPEYILKRFEELVSENTTLKIRIKELEGIKKYSSKEVTNLKAAEPEAKLKKKKTDQL